MPARPWFSRCTCAVSVGAGNATPGPSCSEQNAASRADRPSPSPGEPPRAPASTRPWTNCDVFQGHPGTLPQKRAQASRWQLELECE